MVVDLKFRYWTKHLFMLNPYAMARPPSLPNLFLLAPDVDPKFKSTIDSFSERIWAMSYAHFGVKLFWLMSMQTKDLLIEMALTSLSTPSSPRLFCARIRCVMSICFKVIHRAISAAETGPISIFVKLHLLLKHISEIFESNFLNCFSFDIIDRSVHLALNNSSSCSRSNTGALSCYYSSMLSSFLVGRRVVGFLSNYWKAVRTLVLS